MHPDDDDPIGAYRGFVSALPLAVACWSLIVLAALAALTLWSYL